MPQSGQISFAVHSSAIGGTTSRRPAGGPRPLDAGHRMKTGHRGSGASGDRPARPKPPEAAGHGPAQALFDPQARGRHARRVGYGRIQSKNPIVSSWVRSAFC